MADLGSSWCTEGRYAVATTHVASWCAARDGSVAVFAQYPRRDDSAPVIVFAHGLGGSERGYAALGHALASHGYAVLHPQYLDAFALVRTRLGMRAAEEHTWHRAPDHKAAMHEMLFSPEHWRSRLDRTSAVIEALATPDQLPVALRPDHVIVAGHSFGAYTAQLLLGTQLGGVDVTTACHPAVAGGILLSPQGSGDRGLTARSWDTVTVPLLVVTGTRDRGPHGEGIAWRREPYDAARSARKHLTIVRDGDHLLGGIDTEDATPDGVTVAAVAGVCAAFADLVHGSREAADWLAAGPFRSLLLHEHLDTKETG